MRKKRINYVAIIFFRRWSKEKIRNRSSSDLVQGFQIIRKSYLPINFFIPKRVCVDKTIIIKITKTKFKIVINLTLLF